MAIKSISLVSILFLLNISLMAQNQPNNTNPASKQEEATIIEKTTERVLQFKNIRVIDKTSEWVTVEKKQYRWFHNKEKAIAYFKNMSLKQDWTIVYIDSAEPDAAEPDIFTLTEQTKVSKKN